MGHCVLVFAFIPALFSLPRWLWFELGNTANVHEPLILVFAPIRGFLSLLDAFQSGAAPGMVAGCLHAVLLLAWRWTHEHTPMKRRVVLGAFFGAIAASLAVTILSFVPILGGEPPSLRQLALAAASGVVCGLLATPAALRFLVASQPAEVVAAIFP